MTVPPTVRRPNVCDGTTSVTAAAAIPVGIRQNVYVLHSPHDDLDDLLAEHKCDWKFTGRQPEVGLDSDSGSSCHCRTVTVPPTVRRLNVCDGTTSVTGIAAIPVGIRQNVYYVLHPPPPPWAAE